MGISLYPPLPNRSPFTLVDWDRVAGQSDSGDPRGSRGRPKSGDSQRPRFRWGRCHKASGASGACAEANSSEWRRGGRSSDSGGAGITALIVTQDQHKQVDNISTSQRHGSKFRIRQAPVCRLPSWFHRRATSERQETQGASGIFKPSNDYAGKADGFLAMPQSLVLLSFPLCPKTREEWPAEYCNSSHARCLPVVLHWKRMGITLFGPACRWDSLSYCHCSEERESFERVWRSTVVCLSLQHCKTRDNGWMANFSVTKTWRIISYTTLSCLSATCDAPAGQPCPRFRHRQRVCVLQLADSICCNPSVHTEMCACVWCRVSIYKWLNDSKRFRYIIFYIFYITSPLSADPCNVPSQSLLTPRGRPPVRPPVPPACNGSAATQHSHSPPVVQTEKLNPKSNKNEISKCQAVCEIKTSPKADVFVNSRSGESNFCQGEWLLTLGWHQRNVVPCGTVNLTVKHWIAAACCFCSAFQDFVPVANDLCNPMELVLPNNGCLNESMSQE